jgi:carboxyl-terminal processing protease
VEEVFEASAPKTFDLPMVILIDEDSASASEIFAGALRDHGRALLVGATSFGKGSVQSVFGFNNGAGLKLTSARYLLPNGETINGLGVEPDFEVSSDVEPKILRLLQRSQIKAMDPSGFESVFGLPLPEDAVLNKAIELLSELI